MKRGWALVLLISVGLNLGLGYRLLVGQPDHRGPREDVPREQRPGQRGEGRLQREDVRFGPEDMDRWEGWIQLRLERMAKRMGLTDDQKLVFERIQMEAAGRVGPQMQLVRQARRNLHHLTLAADVPADSLRLAIRLVGRRQAVMDSLVTETLLAELQVLDPEQRRIYMKLMPLGNDQHRGLPAWGRRGMGRRE